MVVKLDNQPVPIHLSLCPSLCFLGLNPLVKPEYKPLFQALIAGEPKAKTLS